MVARDLISDVIPALNTSDTGQKALNWMEVFRISHLPIVNNRELLGLISDIDIFDMNDPREAIGNHELSLLKPFVKEDQHIFDVIGIVAKHKLSLVPVLDTRNVYLGVIMANDLVVKMAQMTSISEPGGIIVISLDQNDYSLSQIAQIVESNNARVLNLYITSVPDSGRMELAIKLNTFNLLPVIRTFERFEYEINMWIGDDKELDDFYSERYDSLMKYLDI